MSDDPMTPVRKRLGEIGDQLRSLPDDDFSAKNKLRHEADSLREQLAERSGPETEATLRRWADRSARKGAQTGDDEVDRAKAAIVSPGEGGGRSV